MTRPWKSLSGEERYRIVELARKGQVAISELCKTFGVSRQTLYRAQANRGAGYDDGADQTDANGNDQGVGQAILVEAIRHGQASV